MEWIKCSDRMPDAERICRVRYEESTCFMAWIDGRHGKWCSDIRALDTTRITEWMYEEEFNNLYRSNYLK